MHSFQLFPRLKALIIAMFMFLGSFTSAEDLNWQALFNGKDLNNWRPLGGSATFTIEGDSIVGTSTIGTANSFLATQKQYGDFILTFDVKADAGLNSGVQIRSLSKARYRDGQVHGYQVEIDTSVRAFSGGIYDEARRGWLYPLSRNTDAQSAFSNGEWNHYRVEVIGEKISTWVNGKQCARLIDTETARGFIALQVHSINDPALAGRVIQWRNIRILTSGLDDQVTQDDPAVEQISFLNNRLSAWEKRKGWRLLWDGKSKNNWRSARGESFPKKGWQIKNGELSVIPSGGKESAGGGDIVTLQQFRDFELQLDFKLAKGANSGIKYFVDPDLNRGPGSAIGLEFQLLDDAAHPDAKMGVAGNRTVGSLYDLIAAENLSVPGRKKQFKGIGKWNHARIIVKNGKVEHWLNHEKVVEYDRTAQIFKSLVAYSKYKDWPGFGQWPAGHILIQDHGDTAHFKNIKVREF